MNRKIKQTLISRKKGDSGAFFCPGNNIMSKSMLDDGNISVETAGSGERQPKTKKKKKKNKILLFIKRFFMVIATTLLSLFIVVIITGTIVATALTVYVLDFMDDSSSITLAELESGSDTYFYGTEIDENGEEQLVVLKHVKTDVQRIPVSIDRIPQHVRNAFVCAEDERFYLHDGVDYKRTFSAFLNMFLHFYDTQQGGSTITQQLIKNLTGDTEQTPQRKIREIFSAMQLEKTYSKDEILEEYLNYIGFGGPRNGIQVAATDYFGKNVEDLTAAEAAVLAAIPQSPEYYGPFVETYDEETKEQIVDGHANNRTRQEYVLWQMYKNGALTYDEYQAALAEKILFTDSPEYKKLHPEVDLQQMKEEQTAFTWEMDALMYEAAGYVMEMYNCNQQDAINRINKGGYRIYSTIDPKMQTYVEQRMSDLSNICDPNWVRKWYDLDGDGEADEVYPHIAFTALGYDGSVLCTVGNWGEKVGSLGTSFANVEPRAVGSTMKPVATYGYGIENERIHWGSVFNNSPSDHIKDEQGNPWPFNYGRVPGDGSPNKIYYYLQQSYNTVPAQLVELFTPHEVFKFSTETLGMNLDPEDEADSPLALGALTYGVTLENLVNAYLPYGNKGVYNKAHVVSKIEDANHQILVDNTNISREAVSAEGAWVMNRLIKNVVENGTGTAARLSNKVVVGKTGTTENWYDLAFIGMTRDFASGVTIGYQKYDEALMLPSSLKSAQVWYNIIGEYANTMYPDTGYDFDPVESVIEAPMCSTTGLIAGEYCPRGTVGYWKSTFAPICDGNHYVAPAPGSQQDAGTDPSGGTTDPGTGGTADPGTGTGTEDPGNGGGTYEPADPGNGGGNDNPGAGGGDPSGGTDYGTWE